MSERENRRTPSLLINLSVRQFAQFLLHYWPDPIDMPVGRQEVGFAGIPLDLVHVLQDEGLIMFEAIIMDQYGRAKLQDAALTRKGQVWVREGLRD